MLDKKQVSIYFRKFLRLLLNKKSLFFVLEAILLPFIISIAFDANEVFDKYHITRTSSIMFISAALWIGLFNSVTSICNERKVIKFEYQIKGLSLPSYVTARVLTELVTKLEFPILHSDGQVVANAVTDPSTQKVTITFTDYFSKNYQDKVMALKYSVRPNTVTLTKPGKYTFTFGTEQYTLNYQTDTGEIGDYEMKYGYQDSENPKRIKWRILLNAVQDKLDNMVIKDDFSDNGQVLVEGSLRAVRYATQPQKIPNEVALLKLEPIDNFTKKAEFTRNSDGKITGFTINFGDNWNWAMYIEYTTELASELPAGTNVSNLLDWSATNFANPRSITALTRLESGSGTGSGDKTTTTTKMLHSYLTAMMLKTTLLTK